MFADYASAHYDAKLIAQKYNQFLKAGLTAGISLYNSISGRRFCSGRTSILLVALTVAIFKTNPVIPGKFSWICLIESDYMPLK